MDYFPTDLEATPKKFRGTGLQQCGCSLFASWLVFHMAFYVVWWFESTARNHHKSSQIQISNILMLRNIYILVKSTKALVVSGILILLMISTSQCPAYDLRPFGKVSGPLVSTSGTSTMLRTWDPLVKTWRIFESKSHGLVVKMVTNSLSCVVLGGPKIDTSCRRWKDKGLHFFKNGFCTGWMRKSLKDLSGRFTEMLLRTICPT